MTSTDRIAQPWGTRTPYGPGADWPVRVDTYLQEGPPRRTSTAGCRRRRSCTPYPPDFRRVLPRPGEGFPLCPRPWAVQRGARWRRCPGPPGRVPSRKVAVGSAPSDRVTVSGRGVGSGRFRVRGWLASLLRRVCGLRVVRRRCAAATSRPGGLRRPRRRTWCAGLVPAPPWGALRWCRPSRSWVRAVSGSMPSRASADR